MNTELFEKAMQGIDGDLIEEAEAKRYAARTNGALSTATGNAGSRNPSLRGTGSRRNLSRGFITAGIIMCCAVLGIVAALTAKYLKTKRDTVTTSAPSLTVVVTATPEPTLPPVTATPEPTLLPSTATPIPTAAPTEKPTAEPTEAPTPFTAPVTGYFKFGTGYASDGHRFYNELYALTKAAEKKYCFVVLNADGTGFYNDFGTETDLWWDGDRLFIGEKTEYRSSRTELKYSLDDNTLTLVYPSSFKLIFERSGEQPPARGEFTYMNQLTGEVNSPYTRMKEATVKDQVLIDDDVAYLVLKRVTLTESGQYQLQFEYENRTDKLTDIDLSWMAVNGVFIGWLPSGSHTYIGPGERQQIKYVISNSHPNIILLSEYGMADPTVLDLKFRIYDTSSNTDWLYSVTAYPMGEEKAESLRYIPGESDVLLADNEYFRVWLIGLWKNKYEQWLNQTGHPEVDTTSLVLIWENKTDSVFSYAARDVDVNGVRVLPGYIIYDEDFFFADTSPGVRTTGVYIFNIDLDFQLRFDKKELADQADFSKYRTIRFDLDVVEELNYDQMTLLETYQVFIDLDSIPLKVSDQFPSMR